MTDGRAARARTRRRPTTTSTARCRRTCAAAARIRGSGAPCIARRRRWHRSQVTRSRRTFLQLGSAGGGRARRRLRVRPDRRRRSGATTRRTGEFQPNAWIRILPDNTVIFTLDRVEMGQGTTTSHATLVAEELEVDPRVLVIEHAEASRAYDNPDKQIRIQITGGSTSTRGVVAAAARGRRGRARDAARRRRGAVGRRRSPSASRATARSCTPRGKHAATLRRARRRRGARRPCRTSRSRSRTDSTWIGKSIDRLDARAEGRRQRRSTASTSSCPGMVTAVLVRPPVRGAKLRAIRRDRGARSGAACIDVVADRRRRRGRRERLLGGAHRRRRARDVEWDEGHGATIDSDALLASYRRARSTRAGAMVARDDGDARSAAQRDDARGRSTSCRTSRTRRWSRRTRPRGSHDGRCEVWAPTQTAGIAQWRVAEALGFDLDDVAIHTTLIGGGFGRRGARRLRGRGGARSRSGSAGRSRSIWSREDDRSNDWYRPMAVSRLRGAVERRHDHGWRHRWSRSRSSTTRAATSSARWCRTARRARCAAIASRLGAAAVRRAARSSTRRRSRAPPICRTRSRTCASSSRRSRPGSRSGSGARSATRTTRSSPRASSTSSSTPPGSIRIAARRELLAQAAAPPRACSISRAQKAGWGTPLPAGVGRGIAVHMSFDSYCAQVVEASVERRRACSVHRVVVAFDCGRVVNPGLVAAQVESAVIFGLSAALKQQITFQRGRVQETNFNTYPALRMFECPVIEAHIVPIDRGADRRRRAGRAAGRAGARERDLRGDRQADPPAAARAGARAVDEAWSPCSSSCSLRAARARADDTPRGRTRVRRRSTRVLESPRCLNCHPAGDAPLQIDDGRPHAMNITRRSEKNGLTVRDLPPRQERRAARTSRRARRTGTCRRPRRRWCSRAARRRSCARSSRIRRRPSGRDLAALIEHVAHDPLVGWGWASGAGPHAGADAARRLRRAR